MRKWVTVGILSLQAVLSQAAETPNPVTHSGFPSDPMSTILLGRDLFYDPILSGNRNIACATCHHAILGSGDGVALAVGEGGAGLGPARHGQADYAARAHVPRNAPALFNLGAAEFTILFHDGRVARDPAARMGFAMPAGATLERPLPSTLAAQALMPVTSPEEMAGAPGENDIADLYGITDLYTLARADEIGMNCVFRKLGYDFCGRLVNNCRMPNGWESMNVWCKQSLN